MWKKWLILTNKKTKVKINQYRLSVPTDDPVANEWCKNQRRGLSIAIRLLIHRQVKRAGTRNLFSTTPEDLTELNENPAKPKIKNNASLKKPAETKSAPVAQTQAKQTNPVNDPLDSDDLDDIRKMMD